MNTPCQDWWEKLKTPDLPNLYAWSARWLGEDQKKDRIDVVTRLEDIPAISKKFKTEKHLKEWTRHLISPETGAHVYLLGTRHDSADSYELVELLINQLKPDAVAVENDHIRFPALSKEIMGERKQYDGLRIQFGAQGSDKPEFTRAHVVVNGLEDSTTSFWLIDHPTPVMNYFNKISWSESIFGSLPSFLYPRSWKKVLLPALNESMDQRNANMTLALRNIPGPIVVGMVGQAHLKGIDDMWRQPAEKLIEQLPNNSEHHPADFLRLSKRFEYRDKVGSYFWMALFGVAIPYALLRKKR